MDYRRLRILYPVNAVAKTVVLVVGVAWHRRARDQAGGSGGAAGTGGAGSGELAGPGAAAFPCRHC